MKDSKVETIPLPVKLTEAEMLERSRELAGEVAAHDEAEDVRKAVAASHKARVDTHATKIRSLSRVVSSGEEHRPVECEWQADAGLRTLKLVRRDTGAVVRSRPMTDEEVMEASQGAFPFVATSVTPIGRRKAASDEKPFG